MWLLTKIEIKYKGALPNARRAHGRHLRDVEVRSMNVKVYYVSPKGCAESVAEAIANELRCTKEALMPAYMPENVSLMFIGTEGSKLDNTAREFLGSLNTGRVRNAALFNCNPKQETGALEEMRGILEGKGINVLDEAQAFPGKGFLSGHKPGEEDLKKARAFAKDSMAKIK